ncbi:MAG: type II toxin-antitoxin system PemK/MazF family toxin [Trueperaceae bacterium]|nr:type II toxin-antitoxin system PemK/MazF family toxin [Trueperaceae bacterium]
MWTASGGANYAGKPRPVVIVQDDAFDLTESVTICGLTTGVTEALIFRLAIEPTVGNGLKAESRLMVDKITTVSRSKLGKRLGELDSAQMVQINRAIAVFLGLTGSAR